MLCGRRSAGLVSSNGLLMRLHILGICGTFMGGVAALARELGLTVEGSDANVYPPMSTQLESLGIRLMDGYKAEHLQPAPDLVVVGNAMTRGNPAVEYMLDGQLRYISGPQWLGETLLPGRRTAARWFQGRGHAPRFSEQVKHASAYPRHLRHLHGRRRRTGA